MKLRHLPILLNVFLFNTDTNAAQAPQEAGGPAPEAQEREWKGRGHHGRGHHGGGGHCKRGDGQGGCERFKGADRCRKGGGHWDRMRKQCQEEAAAAAGAAYPMQAHLSAHVAEGMPFEITRLEIPPYPAVTEIKPGTPVTISPNLQETAKAGAKIKYTVSFKLPGKVKGVTEDGVCEVPADYKNGPLQLRLESTGAAHGGDALELKCSFAYMR